MRGKPGRPGDPPVAAVARRCLLAGVVAGE